MNWLRRRRRRAILQTPFPAEWDGFIAENVVHDRRLPEDQRERLRRLVQVFVAEKNWEGCNGLTISDEIRVTIAAQACLLVLGLENVHYDHVLSILVYPSRYVAVNTEITRAGVVIEGGQPRLGEAWWRGPVVLSWPDALAGGRQEQPGHNLVLHEFAHQLDMMNGRSLDGTPPLGSRADVKRWIEVMQPAYQRLVRGCRRGFRGLIDCYGATNVAEFFAVITETFFESPGLLRAQHPDVYSVVMDYYNLDPASWPAAIEG